MCQVFLREIAFYGLFFSQKATFLRKYIDIFSLYIYINAYRGVDNMSLDEHKKIFSRQLNYYLKFNNKKEADLIRDLGYSSSTVSNWCTGKKIPRMDKVEILANYLNINKSDLIEYKEPILNQPTPVTDQQQMLIDLVCTLNDEQCEALRNLIAQIRLGD